MVLLMGEPLSITQLVPTMLPLVLGKAHSELLILRSSFPWRDGAFLHLSGGEISRKRSTQANFTLVIVLKQAAYWGQTAPLVRPFSKPPLFPFSFAQTTPLPSKLVFFGLFSLLAVWKYSFNRCRNHQHSYATCFEPSIGTLDSEREYLYPFLSHLPLHSSATWLLWSS